MRAAGVVAARTRANVGAETHRFGSEAFLARRRRVARRRALAFHHLGLVRAHQPELAIAIARALPAERPRIMRTRRLDVRDRGQDQEAARNQQPATHRCFSGVRTTTRAGGRTGLRAEVGGRRLRVPLVRRPFGADTRVHIPHRARLATPALCAPRKSSRRCFSRAALGQLRRGSACAAPRTARRAPCHRATAPRRRRSARRSGRRPARSAGRDAAC